MQDAEPSATGAVLQGLLARKLAVVTGASRGIGQAIAEAFAAEKAHLVLTAEAGQEAELQKVMHMHKNQVIHLEL